MVAMEAKYHVRCLVSLYNRARPLKEPKSTDNQYSGPSLDELAFSELITYIEEQLLSEDLVMIRMVELTMFFS